MNSPIYKDYFYTTTAATFEYYIVADGQIIFSGKAWRNPDTNLTKVNVGEIVRDYLRFDLPDFRPLDDVVTKQEDAYKVFTLYDASTGSQLEEYKVLFDWTGEWNGETKVLSNPINKVLDPRMKILWTVYSPTDIDVVMEDGPIVVNTYFRLLTSAITISNLGGSYDIRFLTDYYPYTDIGIYASNGDTVEGLNKSSTGMTIDFSQSPTLLQERNFIVYFYYGDTGNTIGLLHVTQSPIQFELLTTNIHVPASGGTGYPVQWVTELSQGNLCVGYSGPIELDPRNITSSGCTVDVSYNQYLEDQHSYLEIYYCTWREQDTQLLDRVDVTIYGIRQDDNLYVNEIQFPGTNTSFFGDYTANIVDPSNPPTIYDYTMNSQVYFLSGATTPIPTPIPWTSIRMYSGATAPMGSTGTLDMYYRDSGDLAGNITYRVTSVWSPGTGGTATDWQMKDSIKLTYAPKESYSNKIRNISRQDIFNNGFLYGLLNTQGGGDYNSYYWRMGWRTILADQYTLTQSEYVELEYDKTPSTSADNIRFLKSAKSNSFMFATTYAPNAGFSGYTITLEQPEYVGYYISNAGTTGLTDIYIQDTKEFFLSIPIADMSESIYQIDYDRMQNAKARWFRAKHGATDVITVHCTNGNVTWYANEYL